MKKIYSTPMLIVAENDNTLMIATTPLQYKIDDSGIVGDVGEGDGSDVAAKEWIW